MTAVPERTGKYQVVKRPISGSEFWLLAPKTGFGFPDGPDLHLSVERAEEVALLLMQAVDEYRNLEA